MMASRIAVFLSPLRGLFLRLLLRTEPSVKAHGLEFWNFTGDASSDQWINKVGEALHFIEDYNPRLRRRIVRDLRRLVLFGVGGELYDPGVGCYVMDRMTMVARSVPEMALAIVHESIHARLFRRFGVRHQLAQIDRVEHLCINQEVAFAELTGDLSLMQTAREKHGENWWTPQAMEKRRMELRESVPWPSWIA